MIQLIYLDEVIKTMKPKCYGYNCHQDGYGHGHHGMKRTSRAVDYPHFVNH